MNSVFFEKGYFVAREFFDPKTVEIMQTYWNLVWKNIKINEKFRNSIDHSVLKYEKQTIEDHDVGYSFNFYSDLLQESLLDLSVKKTFKTLQIPVLPTYTFTRIYQRGSVLIPHVDRPSCEISATCPIIISDDRPSTIYVSAFKVFDILPSKDESYDSKFSIEDIKTKGDYSKVDLYPGDALFYNGCEHFHWREPLESDFLIQFFMHFVSANGRYKDYVFDGRKCLGLPFKEPL